MLHTETVEAGTLALIKRLSNDPALKEFVLVGGTALALQLGHRKSIDIDLFSGKAFDSKAISRHLDAHYQGQQLGRTGNALFYKLQGIKVDVLTHQYPWIDPVKEIEGIRIASPKEIGAMKLHAIVENGRRVKDFIDMHFLLEKHSLEQLIEAYSAKYNESNPSIARNALLFHKEIDFGNLVDLMDRELDWSLIARRLRNAVVNPKKLFPTTSLPDGPNRVAGPLYAETVGADTLGLMNRLSQDAALKNFLLAGDTALSLQLGHRKSSDLDYLSTAQFDVRELARNLKDRYNVTDLTASRNTLHVDIDGIRVSFLPHPYPLVGPVGKSDGIRMASLEDIGAMKMSAIVNNGRRLKDFVDMHFLLAQRSLDELLNAYTGKYTDANPRIAKRSLLYHDEIDAGANVDLIGNDLKWSDVVKRLKQAVTQTGRVFDQKVLDADGDRNERKPKTGRRR